MKTFCSKSSRLNAPVNLIPGKGGGGAGKWPDLYSLVYTKMLHASGQVDLQVSAMLATVFV